MTVVPAIEHKVGAIGLWETICRIVRQADEEQKDFVLICEDDHGITEHYTAQKQIAVIGQTMEYNADVLLGR